MLLSSIVQSCRRHLAQVQQTTTRSIQLWKKSLKIPKR